MIDRWGNQIIIGWPAHHIIWIEAAMSLPYGQRTDAYREIAELVGRPLHCVEGKAKRLRAEGVILAAIATKRARLKALAGLAEFATEARG